MKKNTDCGMLMKQICDKLEQLSNNELRSRDLTLSQIRYLSYLAENQSRGVELKKIESFFGVTQPTVAGIMNRLEKKNLVKTEVSPKNVRAKIAKITKEGLFLYEETQQKESQIEKNLLANISKNDQEKLKELLLVVFDNIKNI